MRSLVDLISSATSRFHTRMEIILLAQSEINSARFIDSSVYEMTKRLRGLFRVKTLAAAVIIHM